MFSSSQAQSLPRSPRYLRVSVVAAALLFGLLLWMHALVGDADEPDFLYLLPVAIVAAAGGLTFGLAAAGIAFVLYVTWAAADGLDLDAFDLGSRAAAYFLVGGGIGYVVQRLRRANERLRVLIDTAPDAILELDRSGHIIAVNAALERQFGYEREQLVGAPLEVLLPQPGRPDESAAVVLDGRRSDGQRIPVELKLGKSGSVATLILRDVSERERAQKRLDRAREELERSNAALDEFAHVVSHDLTEPLTTVSLYAQTLGARYEERLDQSGKGLLARMLEVVERMEDRIHAVLSYAKVHNEPPAPQEVDASRAAVDALRALDASITARQARVVCARLPMVYGDPAHIQQLFQNLISNAVKFSPDGRRPQVEVSARREGDVWHFSVSDNGPGIDPADLARIFRPFERAGDTSRPGTGIGLAVCRNIVEAHGGRIWAESQSGEGSTFHFTLPAVRLARSA
jgi:signal transduction histidine kinase